MKKCLANLTLITSLFFLTGFHDLTDGRSVLNLEETVSVNDINRAIREKAGQKGGPKTYYFGFDLRIGPSEDARQYLPFLDFLSRATGLGFELRFTSKASSIIDDLGTGRVDFAAIGAVSFIEANIQYGARILARGVNQRGKAEYRSMIVVSPDSAIKTLNDLRGKSFAFGSVSSTQGHLIPRITLSQNGIELSDLAVYGYTGSHRDCANSVIKGTFSACGMQDTMAESLEEEGALKILHVSPYYPSSGIAANQNVPTAVIEKVRQALVDFAPLGRDKENLYDWHKTEMPNGFQIARPIDYDELQAWLNTFGLAPEHSNIGTETPSQ